jgi:hypothetical protein
MSVNNGVSMDIVTAYTGRPKASPKAPSASCGRYDERYGWGKMLAVIGAVLWMIGAVVYIAVGSSGDDSSFDQAANAVTGFVWGGAIFTFGCFAMLCGVIFIAGAQRIDR